MTFAPNEAYHGGRPETLGMTRIPTTNPLVAPGSEEPPDCRLPETARRHCKRLAREAAEAPNKDALIFLAAAVEVETEKKSLEEARA